MCQIQGSGDACPAAVELHRLGWSTAVAVLESKELVHGAVGAHGGLPLLVLSSMSVCDMLRQAVHGMQTRE